MAIYGYCRISTPKQSNERQIRNIKKCYEDAIIVNEVYTGTTQDRPLWVKLCNQVKYGDTIIFDSVSRMSRDAEEGFRIYQDLFDKGVSLVFLKESHINTDTYKNALKNNVEMTGTSVDYILKGVNQYLMELAKEQIRLAFEQSEKEVSDLRQRTKEGIETARLTGKQIGQVKGAKLNVKKANESKAVMKKHCKEFGGTLKDKEIIRMLGITPKTFYKYKREIKAELQE